MHADARCARQCVRVLDGVYAHASSHTDVHAGVVADAHVFHNLDSSYCASVRRSNSSVARKMRADEQRNLCEHACVCVRACVRAQARACACVRRRVRACACAGACVRVRARAHACALQFARDYMNVHGCMNLHGRLCMRAFDRPNPNPTPNPCVYVRVWARVHQLSHAVPCPCAACTRTCGPHIRDKC
eukprot:229269-Pleurochrysis_carterae.AAC.1